MLVLCLVERLITWFELSYYNQYGVRSAFLLVLFVVFNAARNASAKMSILVVSLGYGIT